MGVNISLHDNNLICHSRHDFIISIERRVYSDNTFLLFDEKEDINVKTTPGLEQLERRKGAELTDYFGFDKHTHALQYLESVIRNNCLVVKNDKYRGLVKKIYSDSLTQISFKSTKLNLPTSLGKELFDYGGIDFPEPELKYEEGKTLISYKDGSNFIILSGNDSMGYYSILTNSDGKSLDESYGDIGRLFYYNGLLFLPTGKYIDIMECSSGNKVNTIPEPKKITFGDICLFDSGEGINFSHTIKKIFESKVSIVNQLKAEKSKWSNS